MDLLLWHLQTLPLTFYLLSCKGLIGLSKVGNSKNVSLQSRVFLWLADLEILHDSDSGDRDSCPFCYPLGPKYMISSLNPSKCRFLEFALFRLYYLLVYHLLFQLKHTYCTNSCSLLAQLQNCGELLIIWHLVRCWSSLFIYLFFLSSLICFMKVKLSLGD